MKYKLILLLPILLLLNCESNSVTPHIKNYEMVEADDSNLSDSLKNVFLDDAYRIALNNYLSFDSTNVDSIKIPNNLVNKYYNGLIHIFNEKDFSEIDSIMNIYSIHTWVNPELRAFNLYVDSSAIWIYKWLGAYSYVTGYNKLDSLMENYRISILRIQNITWLEEVKYNVEMFTKDRLNIRALMKLFNKLHGITWAEPRSYGGDGNNIYIEDSGDKLIFTFRLAWGDCPSGCTSAHYWSFEVNYDGEVTFISSVGSSLKNYIKWPPNQQIN